MNYFHLEAKVVRRGAGRSVIAAAAYASCSRLYNDWYYVKISDTFN